MHELSAQRILAAWEYGAASAPEIKTGALIALALPELSTDEILSMTIGERNSHLLELRSQLFGSKLQAYVECSVCAEALDLEYSIEDFGFSAVSELPETHILSLGEIKAEVRLPCGQDLSALETVATVEEGRQLLFSRCVIDLQCNGDEIDLSKLDSNDLIQLEAQISELDPRTEILFELDCPNCSHQWQSPLQLDLFLWKELENYTKMLLENVHLLASSYGWSEQDILAMSNARREHYVQRVLQ